MNQKFHSFNDFFLYYLRQHSCRSNRALHAVGTTLGAGAVIAALMLRHPWIALLWVPVGYAFSWAGHLLVEGNRPATWGHPLWSLMSDFRMLGLMITGQLDEWMETAEEATAPRKRVASAD